MQSAASIDSTLDEKQHFFSVYFDLNLLNKVYGAGSEPNELTATIQ